VIAIIHVAVVSVPHWFICSKHYYLSKTQKWVVPVKDDISAFKIKSKLVVNFLILSLSLMKGYYCDVFFFFFLMLKK
jgi:hypothetical protein